MCRGSHDSWKEKYSWCTKLSNKPDDNFYVGEVPTGWTWKDLWVVANGLLFGQEYQKKRDVGYGCGVRGCIYRGRHKVWIFMHNMLVPTTWQVIWETLCPKDNTKEISLSNHIDKITWPIEVRHSLSSTTGELEQRAMSWVDMVAEITSTHGLNSTDSQ